MAREARRLSVSIERPADEAYAFLSKPANLRRWAGWLAEAPEVRLTEPNRFGVLDHAATLAAGPVYVPLRVVAKQGGCELVLTLFRRPEASEAQYAADAERVMRDLVAAKRLLELA
jgi:hypothetical protein